MPKTPSRARTSREAFWADVGDDMEKKTVDAQRLRRELERGPLLFDGATGTYAREIEGFPEGPVELCCLSAPECVLALHRAYLAAGSRAIKTNTFALALLGERRMREVIPVAYALARQAADAVGAFVFADIGPAPEQMEPFACYRAMADAFLDAGATCFLMETMHRAQGLEQVAAYIRARCSEAFIAVSFAADADGFTRAGESASSLIAQMDACADIDAVGLNCVCGAYHMRRLLSGMPRPQKRLLAMPNAGYPHVENGRTFYDSDPAYYARQVIACRELGASLLGGCCGTTPEHIRQIAMRLEAGGEGDSAGHRTVEGKPLKRVCQSRIRQKLAAGGRAILVELDPPRSADLGSFLRGAQALYASGADAITLADCPIGRARMDSSLLACKLSRELGIEVLPHMTCRDRNVNATQALLLGLSMEGVHNVLAVTGDPVPTCDRGSVKSVFQFNSRVLARFVCSLAQSGDVEPFFLCGALNVNAVNFDQELERAMQKEACGMEAFLTQPVLSERAAENMQRARQALKGWLLGGLFPVVSEKNARFLQSEVAGIALDDAVIRAYEGLNREQGEAMAVRLCTQVARRIAPYVNGFYIMTPFQRVALVQRVISAVRGL